METLKGNTARAYVDASVISIEDMAVGEQVHVNDTTCGDKRGRLYVKRIDGAALFCCHNCGTQGLAPIKEIARLSTTHHIDLSKKPEERDGRWKHTYLTAESDYNKFPLEAQVWLGAYGFEEEECDLMGIRATSEGVLLPIVHRVGNAPVAAVLHGMQVRKYSGVPKYVTYGDTTSKPIAVADNTCEVFYVVEDLLSSYKLFLAGENTVCNLGVKPPSAGWVSAFKNLYAVDTVMVWFDPDEAGTTGAWDYMREMRVHVPQCRSITSPYQPKEIDMEQLVKGVYE